MTDQTMLCPNCQESIPAGSRVCPSCQAKIDLNANWPEWHGEPDAEHPAESEWEAYDDPTATDDYEALALDPKLVNSTTHQPGKRSLLGVWAVCAVVWFLVTRMYEGGDPAAIWDYVWYAAALLTVGLGLWLLVVLLRRARTHGAAAAVRWLVS